MSVFDPPKQQPTQVTNVWREPPPHDKPIEISLLYFDMVQLYRVMTIKNTNYYRPGEWLNHEIVAKLCEMPKWTVTSTYFDFWKTLLDEVGSHLPTIGIP